MACLHDGMTSYHELRILKEGNVLVGFGTMVILFLQLSLSTAKPVGHSGRAKREGDDGMTTQHNPTGLDGQQRECARVFARRAYAIRLQPGREMLISRCFPFLRCPPQMSVRGRAAPFSVAFRVPIKLEREKQGHSARYMYQLRERFRRKAAAAITTLSAEAHLASLPAHFWAARAVIARDHVHK
jgi:hypothetical protein